MNDTAFSKYIDSIDRWEKIPKGSSTLGKIFLEHKDRTRMFHGSKWAITWGDIFLVAKQTIDENREATIGNTTI